MNRCCILVLFLCGILGPATANAQIVSAGADTITGDGGPDGWTNVLYINEANPFSFAGTGQTQGVLTTFNFWAARGIGVVTPFVAEPLVPDPISGSDYVIRAIGTTREGGTDWQCIGEYALAFHETEQFTVQEGWVAGFVSSDPLGERDDALSPIPFVGGLGVDGWLTGTSTAASGAPAIELNETILEGGSGTNTDAYGLREYQFQVRAAAGTVQPPLGPLGKVGDACPQPAGGNVAGTHPLLNQGVVDTSTNILYINEAKPFDFSEFGAEQGTLTDFNFVVGAGHEASRMVTPFVAEPLVDNPTSGSDFIIRAIGTTREGGVDWNEAGEHSFPFSDTETFVVQSGWLAGFLSADSLSESDLAGSPIPFDPDAGVHGWLTHTAQVATGSPAIELNEAIQEGTSGTNADAYGFRRYYFNIVADVEAGVPGDFNGDGSVDAADIDLLATEVSAGTNAAKYDLNDDGSVNFGDSTLWVEEIKNTYFGDSNLDGEFNSGDLVHVFQRGKYEDAVENNAGWDDGDWDGDQDFTSSDFVIAFQGLGYEQGPRAAVNAVPEPASLTLLLCGLLSVGHYRRRTARS